ncbi:MAG: tRNA guanosine(34) transglycosylase Tgt [Thermodesulfobacteriota bacterium]
MAFSFKVEKSEEGGRARAGRLTTSHGAVNTPLFMPVGTQGTVKGLTPEEVRELGAEMILCNTYHLYLRPGHKVIEELGGLHGFMGWDGPILTDSGGFQLFSLGALREIREEGVTFQSHLDGSRHLLTPERAIEIQETLGADIIMCLDECTPYPATIDYTRESMELTHRWAKRCRDKKSNSGAALFGIVQGGMSRDLRRESAEAITAIGFDGYAIGGLSVGEGKELMYEMLESAISSLPADRPRYLMGVGTPEDLVEAVAQGVDLFDCVLPTRNGRNGTLFTNGGKLVIKNARFARDRGPIDERCGCYTCRHYSRAYLRHLHLAGEMLAPRLNTVHNLHYYMELMAGMRAAIQEERFGEFRRSFYEARAGDDEAPHGECSE